MRRRKRLDSECEVCYSWLGQRLSMELTTALIPQVLVQCKKKKFF